MRRLSIAFFVGVIVTALVATTANASPVATSTEEYTVYNRIFPDPHGCQPRVAPYSPFAKGRVCANDFIQFSEMESGTKFLEDTFPRFVKVYQLDKDFDCKGRPVKNSDKGCQEFKSAGLPQTLPEAQGNGFSRKRMPLYMVRITDESVPLKGKRYFVFSLGMHGIERAGVEGGTRAAEDLATWGACEAKVAPDFVDCASDENKAPHPLLEANPDRSITAGDALKKSAIFFIYPNPDGWYRGDRANGTSAYQRYNGNGVDMNRDWPEQGFTFRPYTPWSEPETRAFGRALQGIGPTDENGDPKWTGGIDLHGQLIDRAFSFTLIGGSQRPWDKNQRILQTVKGAWSDAEKRLAWSPLIKPNDAPTSDPRVYGVQWGTVWDTIAYTVTGALGDWMDSPIGLNADGIDNEMSVSHVSNCGTGTCFDPDIEQLHVDGNKSLIYAMVNYSLKPESTAFKTKGRVGYLFNRGVISEKDDPLTIPPKFEKYPTQNDIPSIQLDTTNNFEYRFTVKGPKDHVYNGGIGVTLTCANANGVGPCALDEARLERKPTGHHHSAGQDDWEVVNSYYNQGSFYVQAGQALHANMPLPGRYRVVIDGANPSDVFTGNIHFSKEKAWPDPGQVGYKVTSMNFWKMLRKYMRPGLKKVTAAQIERGKGLKKLDTIVITNKVYKGLATKLRRWVKAGGNLVLTDKALRMLGRMKITKGKGAVKPDSYYAGYINFATAGREETYKDQLARKIDQAGAAEGSQGDEAHIHQVYEPVPLGYAIQTPEGSDAYTAPVYAVQAKAWNKIKTKHRAAGTTGNTSRVSLGEVRLGKGRIRFIGGLLPNPTKVFDHPFGLASYALTYSGYQVLHNALTWKR